MSRPRSGPDTVDATSGEPAGYGTEQTPVAKSTRPTVVKTEHRPPRPARLAGRRDPRTHGEADVMTPEAVTVAGRGLSSAAAAARLATSVVFVVLGLAQPGVALAVRARPPAWYAPELVADRRRGAVGGTAGGRRAVRTAASAARYRSAERRGPDGLRRSLGDTRSCAACREPAVASPARPGDPQSSAETTRTRSGANAGAGQRYAVRRHRTAFRCACRRAWCRRGRTPTRRRHR